MYATHEMAFSVTCPSCGKSFQLAQEIYDRKVAGKVVSIKCKQCQVGIRIDATEAGALKVLGATPIATGSESVGGSPPAAAPKAPAGAPAAAATAPRARQATLLGMMGPGGSPIMKAAAEPAPSEGALWAVDSGGTGDDRELDDMTIGREIATGKISATTLVWRDGMSDWLEVAKVPQLARLLPKPKAEAPKVSAPLPAARGPGAPVAAPVPAAAPLPGPPRPPAPSAPIITEADEEEATMIYRSSPDAAAKLGLPELPAENTPPPAAPPPAAGRPAPAPPPAAPPPAAGRPAPAPLPAPPPAAGRPAPPPLAAPTPAGGRPPSAPRAAPAPAPAAQPAAPPAAPAPPVVAAPPPPPAPPDAAAPPAPAPAAAAPLPAAPPPPPSPPPPAVTGAPIAPAPAPPPMRAKQPSAPGLPKGLTPPPPLAAPPAPPPVPSPPPPAPSVGAPPFVPTANPYAAAPGAAQGPGFAQLAPGPFAVPTTTDLEFPEPRKKTPLIIGGIVLVLAAAAIAVVVTQSKAPPPPPVPTVAPTLPTSTPPNATPTNTPVPDVPTPSSAPQDDIAGRPAPAPAAGNDFSQMFAQGAEKAQKGSPSGAAKSFDAEEARAAVAGVLKAVAACKEAGGATGQSSAAVTFDASGQVSSVTVGAPFAGTSTGTCIITALKAAKVTPFSGLPGTVSQPVSLQ